MAIAASSTREIVCPGCGRRRTVSDRNARRKPQNCNLCRHPGKRKAPDDSDRRFWLKHFSDKEILEMAEGIFGDEPEAKGDPGTVRAWRSLLLPDVDSALIGRVKETNGTGLLPEDG